MEVIFSKEACQADSSRSERVFDFSAKLEDLKWKLQGEPEDFDQGKSPSIPWPWLNIGPINLILPRFVNIQTSWPPFQCWLSQNDQGNFGHDDFFCYVGSKFSFQVGLGIDATSTEDPDIQQTLFAQSQGISVIAR